MLQSEFERVMRATVHGMRTWKPNVELIERERRELNGLLTAYAPDAAIQTARQRVGAHMREFLFTDQQRAEVKDRLERAQAARGARLVRAAAENPFVGSIAVVSPDTVWSGDFNTLVRLCNFGVSRMRFQYEQRARGFGRTAIARKIAHEQP